MPTPRLSEEKQEAIRRFAAQGLSRRETARRLNISESAVRNYWPASTAQQRPQPQAFGTPFTVPASTIPLPDSLSRISQVTQIDTPGWWLVLSDVHVPFHDRTTVERAVETAREAKVVGVLLNGDILDFHGISRHDRTPDDVRYKTEVDYGRRFFAYLRGMLPSARIVFKAGNHEERLFTFLMRQAPELFGLDVLQVPNLLQLTQHGIEYYEDRRVIRLGRLNVIHGHEYPGASNPVNPARGLFLRAKSIALCSHYHQTSEHSEPTIASKPLAAWSIGCACQLSPLWLPFNKWNHGFALVRLQSGGDFEVRNHRIVNGMVV